MKIGFVGVGVVGGITAQVLGARHTVYLYDKYKEEHQDIDALARNAEVVFICVPTPMKPNGKIDYSAIHGSLDLLEETVRGAERDPQELLVAIRSTAVSGTTDALLAKYPFRFAFNPEFLREKHALGDMENTARVVIGANDERSRDELANVYRPVFPNAQYIFMDTKTAEMTKYTANVLLAAQIALANEIYNICKSVGVDYDTVKQTVLLDERVARNIDVPGHDGDFGFGGKCFPKDLNALIYLARENMYRPYLLEEVWRLNERVRKDRDWLDIDGAVSDSYGEKDSG